MVVNNEHAPSIQAPGTQSRPTQSLPIDTYYSATLSLTEPWRGERRFSRTSLKLGILPSAFWDDEQSDNNGDGAIKYLPNASGERHHDRDQVGQRI